ncbi:MAG TPA: MFS transporter, partial [Verrucomicrobiae bacterium]|nr:MFS transporter [Verrucomicrobiae bacterium]
YLVHNICNAACALAGGRLADRFPKKWLLALGYLIGAGSALSVIALPATVWAFGIVFILAGASAALEETVEDAFCAELVDEPHHGMGFGVLATVNGIGDFVSSIIVGWLWSAFGTSIAFGYSLLLCMAGAGLVSAIRAPSHS